MDEARFVAIVGCHHFFGAGPLKPGQRVKLMKEPDNTHDPEAIKVELDPVGQVGYVANSVHTVPKGCCSAGRIYDHFGDEAFGVIRFVIGDRAVVEVERTERRVE